MKKLLLVFAISAFGLVGLQAQTVTPPATAVEQTSQDRVKISPNDIPQAVKTTISEKADTQDLRITEAYQVTNAEGELHYEVHFDKEGEVVTKKYNAAGEEIKED
jgi:predicted Co/Zn/Cd cation transporter (cation efflux family)